MSTPTNVQTITAATLKAVRSHARIAAALVLALQDFTDAALSDSQKVRAKNSAATIGAKMLAVKNALPTNPAQLRMHVESIKQKVAAIVASLSTDKTFSNHCERAAILKSATACNESVDTFLKEYNEHKATVQATQAKAA